MEKNGIIGEEEYKNSDYWGIHVAINMRKCDHALITNKDHIRKYVEELTDLINMKRYGDTLIERFGEGELYGYSMFQFIETSSISAHFDEVDDRAFIDIFSCAYYDQKKAAEFTANFFKAKEYEYKVILRK